MLKHLELTNFRNYDHYSLDLAKTTFLVGPNGIGKTNLLEAIYLLSTGRSWRTNRDVEVIKWGKDFSKIITKKQNEDTLELEMVIQRQPTPERPRQKLIKINSIKKKLADLLGRMPTVLFSPEEMQIISGPPVLRRRFLDILLCQIDKKYTLALFDLSKIIQGRNKLLFFLKQGRSKINELAFWDEKLITLGSFIIKKRQKTLEALNLDLPAIYQEIAGTGEKLTLKYQPTVMPDNFKETIESMRQREIEQSATLIGPHRDDLIFLLENKEITTFGSRGEYRSAVLAAKMAEVEFLAKEKEERPTLLLDDIFSELDKNRREHLEKIVLRQQTIITTTDLDHIEKGLRVKGKIVDLNDKIRKPNDK